MTLIMWKDGKVVVWDLTAIALCMALHEAEITATRKTAKYCSLAWQYTFRSVELKTLDPLNEDT